MEYSPLWRDVAECYLGKSHTEPFQEAEPYRQPIASSSERHLVRLSHATLRQTTKMTNHVARIGPMANRNKTPRTSTRPRSGFAQFACTKTRIADKRAGVIVPPCPAPKNPGANATAKTPDRQKMRLPLSSMRPVSFQPVHSTATHRPKYPMIIGYWSPYITRRKYARLRVREGAGHRRAHAPRRAQRLRFLARMLRRLPFRFNPPGPRGLSNDPVSPKTGVRGRRASASLTRRLLPLNWWPSNLSMAFAAAASSANSTKANPLGRPVLRSTGRNTPTTWPTSEKRLSSSLCVVSKLKFPTNTLALMVTSSQVDC